MVSLLPLTQPSVSSPHSGQSHLLTLKTLQWLPISLRGKGKISSKSQVVLLSADSLTSPPIAPSHSLTPATLASELFLQSTHYAPAWPLHCGSLCVGIPRYPHCLLPHFLRAFLTCHLMGKAFLISCSSILPILLSLVFLHSTDHHRKRSLSLCPPLQKEKVHQGRALFCSLREPVSRRMAGTQ